MSVSCSPTLNLPTIQQSARISTNQIYRKFKEVPVSDFLVYFFSHISLYLEFATVC